MNLPPSLPSPPIPSHPIPSHPIIPCLFFCSNLGKPSRKPPNGAYKPNTLLPKKKTFQDLHAYSLAHRSQFWTDVFAAADLVYSGGESLAGAVDESAPIDAVPRWFAGVELNFAENLLFPPPFRSSSSSSSSSSTAATTAVTEVREGGGEVRHVSWGELRTRAGRAAAAMRARGVGRGDRVVAVGGNGVGTLVVWLAAAWVGAVFCSCSADMGVGGILQRAVQVDPKVCGLFFLFAPFLLSWGCLAWGTVIYLGLGPGDRFAYVNRLAG